MKPILFFILAVFCVPFAVPAQSAKLIVAKTETPTLLSDEGGTFFALNEEAFAELSRKYSSMPHFVGIKRKPSRLTATALFGFNIVVQGKNISWILDRDAKNDYVIYADFNADGDLSNDAPFGFKKTDGGRLIAEVRKTLTETIDNRKRKYPFALRLEIQEKIAPGKTEKETVLRYQPMTLRRGSINIDDRKIAFALNGNAGLYDYEIERLYFDLNGDGKFDSEDDYSPEVFRVNEKHVNFGDRSYEYTVDRYGENLTLKPLAEKLPPRADLRVGSLAPDFSFTDQNGNRHRLSEFRGKIVLIDIWAIWCAPCIREAPQLAAVYKRLKERNFEIVSLNKNDPPDAVRKFIAENQMNWTHTTTEPEFLTLYRVDHFPSYFLLDKDGKIISNTLRAGEEMYKKIDELTAF